MNKWVLAGSALLLIVLIWLAFAVNEDANTPLGPCQDVVGSVCSPTASCPDGFVDSPRYTCEPANYLCCVPG